MYTGRAAQTFLEEERTKSTQLVGEGVKDKGQLVNEYMMFDDYKAMKDREHLQKLKEEGSAPAAVRNEFQIRSNSAQCPAALFQRRP